MQPCSAAQPVRCIARGCYHAAITRLDGRTCMHVHANACVQHSMQRQPARVRRQERENRQYICDARSAVDNCATNQISPPRLAFKGFLFPCAAARTPCVPVCLRWTVSAACVEVSTDGSAAQPHMEARGTKAVRFAPGTGGVMA